MRKPFDRALYEQNDKLARKNVKKLFAGTKYKIIDNSKKTDVDLLVLDENDNHVMNIETERKIVWKGKKFPYDSVQLPERKAKYLTLDKPTTIIMFNEGWDSYLVMKDKDILESPLEIVPNKYVSYGEKFFKVDMKKVVFDDIQNIVKQLENNNGK